MIENIPFEKGETCHFFTQILNFFFFFSFFPISCQSPGCDVSVAQLPAVWWLIRMQGTWSWLGIILIRRFCYYALNVGYKHLLLVPSLYWYQSHPSCLLPSILLPALKNCSLQFGLELLQTLFAENFDQSFSWGTLKIMIKKQAGGPACLLLGMKFFQFAWNCIYSSFLPPGCNRV